MYKKILLSTLLCAVANIASAGTKELNFVKQINQEINYAEAHQADVWPGFHPASKATVISFQYDSDEQHPSAYALNFKPGSLPWVNAGIGASSYYLANAYNLDIYNMTPGLGYFADVDGSDSYVTNLSTEFAQDENMFRTVTEERARQFLTTESAIDKKSLSSALNINYDGFTNLDIIKLVFLEDAALNKSQASNDQNESEKALQDAIAIHQYREKLVNAADNNDFENNMELLEGIPRYIALQSKQLNEKQYRLLSQRTGCMPVSVLSGTESSISCMVAGFPTYSGTVYSRALDKKVPQLAWKKLVIAKFKAPSNILSDYYHFNNKQIKMMTAAAKKNPAYNFARIEKIVNANMKEYLDKLQAAKKQYLQQQGIELRLDNELGNSVYEDQYTDTPRATAVYQISLSSYLCTDVNYGIENDYEKPVNVKNLPFMVYHMGLTNGSLEPESKDSYTALKLDDNASIVIDGVNYTAPQLINEKKVIEFKSMDINDSHLHYEQHYVGKLDASKGFLKVYTPVNSKK